MALLGSKEELARIRKRFNDKIYKQTHRDIIRAQKRRARLRKKGYTEEQIKQIEKERAENAKNEPQV